MPNAAVLMPRGAELAAAAAVGAVAAALLLRRRREAVDSREAVDGLPRPGEPRPPVQADEATISRVLDVIERDVLPMTRERVPAGDKVFGAAILDDKNETVVAATNRETACPIYHGEIRCIEDWAALPAKPAAGDSLFVATHEPCCLCMSAIVWSGFNKCVFLFPYETTRDQGIPHDLDIMYELWRVPRYQRRNRYCATRDIASLVAALPPGPRRAALEQRAKDLMRTSISPRGSFSDASRGRGRRDVR
mmetsp:Transcript_35574/g.107045  ORF Transcript_35574/g.107045 Transcript_35574/m.107045 type:complete len:249 (-) Transcript_35574:445-1191(-)